MITNVDPDRRNVLLTGATLAIASVLSGATTPVADAGTSSPNPQPLPPSPGWERAMPANPDGLFEVLFHLYGPEKPFFDKKWVLPDIERIAAQ